MLSYIIIRVREDVLLPVHQYTPENTEWAIKNEQSRDTGNIVHKIQNEDK
jgi:hypothetical protein